MFQTPQRTAFTAYRQILQTTHTHDANNTIGANTTLCMLPARSPGHLQALSRRRIQI